MPEIVMPRLSDSMEEGTILAWLKQVGEEIAIGDELVEIETDKANMAYESDVAGTLTEILAEEGATLPIGSPIAVIGDAVGGPGGFRGGFGRGTGRAGLRLRSRRPPPPCPPARAPPRRGRPPHPRRPRMRGCWPAIGLRPSRRAPRPDRVGPTATGSRPRRSPGGWLGSRGSTWRRSRAPGPAVGS